jgi:hypothetical protein
MKVTITVETNQAAGLTVTTQQLKDDMALIWSSISDGKFNGTAIAPGITYEWRSVKDDELEVIAA